MRSCVSLDGKYSTCCCRQRSAFLHPAPFACPLAAASDVSAAALAGRRHTPLRQCRCFQQGHAHAHVSARTRRFCVAGSHCGDAHHPAPPRGRADACVGCRYVAGGGAGACGCGGWFCRAFLTRWLGPARRRCDGVVVPGPAPRGAAVPMGAPCTLCGCQRRPRGLTAVLRRTRNHK